MNSAAAKAAPFTRPWSSPWEETSIDTQRAPRASQSASCSCSATASGVVCVAGISTLGKPMPSVPITAVGRRRRFRHCAIQCEQEVLPLVPVTPATHILRDGSP